jgi:N-acylneuraminate cytidylyltransferase
LRTSADIDAAVDLYLGPGTGTVCSVYRCDDNHPARMYRIEEGMLQPLVVEWSRQRRQELPPVYHRNGAMYVFGRSELVAQSIIGDVMRPYVMSRESSINVDAEIDLAMLEAVLASR